jgi:hypothetical protein
VWVQIRTEEQTTVKSVGSGKHENSVLLANTKLLKREHRTTRKKLERFRSTGKREQVGAGRRDYGTCTLRERAASLTQRMRLIEERLKLPHS